MATLPLRNARIVVSDEALSTALHQVKRVNDSAVQWFGSAPWEAAHEPAGESWLITVTAGMPVVNGFTVLGFLDKGSYAAAAASEPLQPENISTTAPTLACIYCGTRRERSRFIVRNGQGALQSIGVRCGEHQTFMPEHAPADQPHVEREITAALKAALIDPVEEMHKVETRVNGLPKYDTLHLLASARRHYRSYEDGPQSPASLARLIAMDAEYSTDVSWLPEISNALLEAAVVRAEFLERPVTTDFADAVRRALLRSENTAQSFRLIAAVPGMHARMARVERAVSAGDPIPGQNYLNAHFGQTGQRYTLENVIVERVRPLESGSVLVSMRGPEGHRLTWFSSTGQVPEDGQHITLTGTVKAHNVYRDVPDTLLTRCKYV